MCSIGDDGLQHYSNKVMLKEEYIKFIECNKCRSEKPCIVLRNKDPYCKICFLAGVTHKFKSILGKSHLIRPLDNVLVCYEIGHPSTALLHLLRSGLDLNTPKKLQFRPMVLFIDDQYQLGLEERQSLIELVHRQVTYFGFDIYFISFAEYVRNPVNIHEMIVRGNLKIYSNDKKEIDKVVDRRASETYRLDILKNLKKDLLTRAARHLGCKFVFTPEISMDLASQLLTNVSLGRGFHIPIDTGFCDDRNEDVKILRPLRLFSIKEIAFYNKYNNIEPLFVTFHEPNPYSTVQDLMKKFIADLQSNFPATVTTILKTGDKLSLNTDIQNKCQMCKGKMLWINSQLTSEESTKFSHLVSTENIDHDLTRQMRYAHLLDKFNNGVVDRSGTNLKQWYYSYISLTRWIQDKVKQ